MHIDVDAVAYQLAAHALRPGQVRYVENTYEDIQWTCADPPTREEMDAEAEAQKESVHLGELRRRRNALLSQSDWTQLPDAPASASAWASYRQELRDLPETTDDPANPTWPTPPE